MTQAETFRIGKNTRYLGKKIFHLDTCETTQIYLKKLLQGGEKIGTVVISDQQTKGRGQHGRTWIDTGLSQLFCSLSVMSDLPVQQLPIINIATALSAIEVLKNYFSVLDLHVKWPNDIYLGEHKIGGVISEIYNTTPPTSLIVGIGINFGGLQTQLPESIQKTSTTLFHKGYTVDQMKFLNEFIVTLETWLESPQNALTMWIQESFALLNLHKNQKIEIQQGDKRISGIAQAIDKNGRLLLASENDDKIIVSSGHICMES